MNRHDGARQFAVGMVLTAIAVGLLTGWANAQPTTQETVSDTEWRRQTEARLQQLEQENRELRKQVGTVAETQQAVMKDAESRGFLTLEGGQPRLTTPDFFDVNKFASEGDFPGSFLIPGTKTSFQIGGFVQLDTIFDTKPIGNEDAFVVNTIPTRGGGDEGSGDTNFSIRQTRLFLKTQSPTKEWGNLVSYIEVDFFGTDGAEPRIRHAYGQIGDKFQLLAGQTWTAFQDATIFPAALDFQGPAGIITSRRPQLRVRQEFDKQWVGVISIEDPNSELTTPAGEAGEDSTPYPDLAGNIRWNPDWGHVQLSGVLRMLQFNPDVGGRQSVVGYGLNLTGSIKTFRVDDKHIDSVLYQLAAGNGITRYINDTGGLGLDAVLATPGGSLEGLNAVAGVLAYQHWWATKWASTFGYSVVALDNVGGEPGSDYHSGQYALLNLRYYPADRVLIGGEVLYGIRSDNDGNSGDDLRLQFSVQYRF
jgi:DcaP outer membrane protein